MARSMRLARDMYIVLLLHLAWALMAVPVVTRQQRVPASAATWLALILLLPVAGTLLYILAGYRRNGPAADCPACRGDRLEQIIAHGCGTRPTRYNPRRAAPQRQQRLHGTDRLVATGHALDPHGVLHHPRRPHRAYHRRNTDPQSPRGARGAGDLRCRRLVAPEPQDTAPHARRGGRDCGFRTGSLPVVHHARHAPQPPQDSGHRRQGRLPGRHKHRQILPRRGLHG